MTNKRKRVKILVAGALIGSMLSVGAATNVSANSGKKSEPVVEASPDLGGTVQALFSGIRW